MSGVLAIEGWASLYEEEDLNGDVVAPGAFALSLFGRRPGDVKLLWQHAAETPIGRWVNFEDRPKGLYARGEILLATRAGTEAAALVSGGVVDGLSIGYRAVRASRSHGRRRILEADLWEVSLVTFPMARGARIARVGAAAESLSLPAGDPAGLIAASVRRAAKILSA